MKSIFRLLWTRFPSLSRETNRPAVFRNRSLLAVWALTVFLIAVEGTSKNISYALLIVTAVVMLFTLLFLSLRT